MDLTGFASALRTSEAQAVSFPQNQPGECKARMQGRAGAESFIQHEL